MSAVLPSPPAARAEAHRKADLPSFRALAVAGFSANAPFLAFWLLLDRSWLATSQAGGYLLALVVYGLLFAFVRKKLPTSLVPLLAGKFLIVGAATVLLLCVLHVAVLWLLAGFLITQVGVTSCVMRHLKMTKVTD